MTDGGVTCEGWAERSCSGHGTCVDDTAGARCACAEGYSGATCDACAMDYQDRDNDGACTPACTASSCSGHGACADFTGALVCTCSGGYVGLDCATCDQGLQDRDVDGVCSPVCTTSTCSGHGACDDATGTATCTCSGGYAPPTCAACQPGTQDFDGDGVCRPTCATAGLTCGGLATCEDSTGTARCVCFTGFDAGVAPDGGFACVWVGVVSDPDFLGSTSWTAHGGLTLDPSGTGTARCDGTCAWADGGTGGVRQAGLVMPPAAAGQATPFALVSHMFGAPLSVRLGSAWVGLGDGDAWNCLGDDIFGPGRDLSAWVYQAPPAGTPTSVLDSLAVAPQLRCPFPGEVLNGNFGAVEVHGVPGFVGWQGSGGGAVVSAGAINGTAGGELRVTQVCDAGASLESWVSVPSTMAGPALRYQASSQGGATHSLVLETNHGPLGVEQVNSTPRTITQCLGAWAAGSAFPVSFRVEPVQQIAGCSHSPLVWSIDDVTLVSEPGCATASPVRNGGFEDVPAGSGWLLSSRRNALAGVASGAGLGHGASSNVLTLTAQTCSSASAAQVVAPGAGQGVRYWYRVNSSTQIPPMLFATLKPLTRDGAVSVASPFSTSSVGTWQSKTLCVPRELAGVPWSFEAVVAVPSSLCSIPAGTVHVDLDDVEVVSDAGCP